MAEVGETATTPLVAMAGMEVNGSGNNQKISTVNVCCSFGVFISTLPLIDPNFVLSSRSRDLTAKQEAVRESNANKKKGKKNRKNEMKWWRERGEIGNLADEGEI